MSDLTFEIELAAKKTVLICLVFTNGPKKNKFVSTENPNKRIRVEKRDELHQLAQFDPDFYQGN